MAAKMNKHHTNRLDALSAYLEYARSLKPPLSLGYYDPAEGAERRIVDAEEKRARLKGG